MLVAVAGIPTQIRDAWARSRTLDLPGRHSQAQAIAVLGMGGSRHRGRPGRAHLGGPADAAAAGGPRLRAAGLGGPRHAGRRRARSRGATEETLAPWRRPSLRRCPVAVITTGGPLGAVAEKAQPAAARVPRGWSAAGGRGLVRRRCSRGSWSAPARCRSTDAEVEAAAVAADAALAAWGPGCADRGQPRQAARLGAARPAAGRDRVSGPLAAVARRWKTQLNENAKTMAVWDELPEAEHNTIVGYPQPESTTDHQFHLFLAASSDHPRNTLRRELAAWSC